MARTRAALRQSLSADAAAAQQALPGASLPWWAHLTSLPVAALLMRALSLLAKPHPLQSAALAAAAAGGQALAPALKRHPLGVVAGAFVAGGLIVLSRPWRWALKPSLLAVLLPRLLSVLMSHQARPLTASTPKREPSAP